ENQPEDPEAAGSSPWNEEPHTRAKWNRAEVHGGRPFKVGGEWCRAGMMCLRVLAFFDRGAQQECARATAESSKLISSASRQPSASILRPIRRARLLSCRALEPLAPRGFGRQECPPAAAFPPPRERKDAPSCPAERWPALALPWPLSSPSLPPPRPSRSAGSFASRTSRASTSSSSTPEICGR